jgi:hypothetical protein
MDNPQEIPEYLEELPRGGENVEPRDLAWALLHDLEYDAQVMAIRILLSRQRQADEKRADEINRLDEYFRKSSGHYGERAVDEWVDLLHSSVYQAAAHSTAYCTKARAVARDCYLPMRLQGTRQWP